MPRFANARATVCATCWSTPARICGSTSRSVTSAPTSTRNDANSQPIAPPPIDRDARRHLVELEHVVRGEHARPRRTRSPRSAGAAATNRSRSTTLRPRSSVPSETRIVRPSGASVPVPGTTVTLRPLSSDLEPARQPVDHLLLADLRDRRGRARARRSARRTRPRRARCEHLGRLQELLGGDAAAVQAGAADPALLDHGDVHARPTRRKRRRVAARARRPARRDRIRSVTVGHLSFASPSRSPIREAWSLPRSVGEDRHLDRERHEDRQPGDAPRG